VRAEGLEPSRTFKPCGFSYHFGFRRPARRVRGLDYPFTIPPRGGLRCCPSSLYTFPQNIRAWLGIAIQGFPDFEQFCSAGFPGGHSIFLKSAASADFATPA
jgi:hypothetical protein